MEKFLTLGDRLNGMGDDILLQECDLLDYRYFFYDEDEDDAFIGEADSTFVGSFEDICRRYERCLLTVKEMLLKEVEVMGVTPQYVENTAPYATLEQGVNYDFLQCSPVALKVFLYLNQRYGCRKDDRRHLGEWVTEWMSDHFWDYLGIGPTGSHINQYRFEWEAEVIKDGLMKAAHNLAWKFERVKACLPGEGPIVKWTK